MAVYLDNNATSFVPEIVIKEIGKWYNTGNPSAHNFAADRCKLVMEETRTDVAKYFKFSLDKYYIIFNSGASEGNCYVLNNVARNYRKLTGMIPHIIVSSVEHKSLLECARILADDKLAVVTYIDVNLYGEVDMKKFKAAVAKPHTALVSIMSANNETGIINNIKPLIAIAHEHNIPFHTDAVQIVGKTSFNIGKLDVDAVTISAHKMYGPIGIGMCIIKKELVEGYSLCSEICGTQNYSLRGGTENVPYIAGIRAAIKFLGNSIVKTKIEKLIQLKDYIIDKIDNELENFFIEDFSVVSAKAAMEKAVLDGTPCVFWIAPKKFKDTLPNTILMAIYKPEICNDAIVAALSSKKIIVSKGSACNSDTDSHVLVAHNVPKILYGGVIRISLGVQNTISDIDSFIDVLISTVISSKSVRKLSCKV